MKKQPGITLEAFRRAGTSLSDEDLLTAVLEGSPGAFDAFVEAYGRRLMAFGQRMCRHREDAEDVFQEALLKAFQGLERLRDPGAVRTWLYRVAANQCRMLRRKEPPERKVSLSELGPPGEAPRAAREIADRGALPDEEAGRQELRDSLEEALETIPPEPRMVLLLRDAEGLSTKETAEVLGIGISAVKMRLSRARKALRERLGSRFDLAAFSPHP